MANESSVLVVSSRDLPPTLVNRLEAAGLFVERTTPADLPSVFEVVGPDLVLQWGSEQWEEVATLVAGGPDPRRVRVVAVVERGAMAEVRKANRAIVASVLADDMPEKTLIERVLLLAQKSSHQARTGERGGSSLIPLASLGALASESPPPVARLETSGAPRPIPAREPKPLGTGPAATLEPPRRPAPPRAVTRASASPPPPPPEVPRVAAKPPLAPPAPAPAPAKPSPAKEKQPTAQGGRARSPLSLSLRLALIDDDVTRGDALASALRGLGHQVQLYPSDPARTRWAVLRKFSPELIVCDGNASPPTVWLELLRADAHLRQAELVTAPYRRLYDESNGQTELSPLVARLSGTDSGRQAASAAARGAEGPPRDEDDDDEDDDRPTTVHPESSLHLAVTTTNAQSPFAAGEAGQRAEQPSAPGGREAPPTTQAEGALLDADTDDNATTAIVDIAAHLRSGALGAALTPEEQGAPANTLDSGSAEPRDELLQLDELSRYSASSAESPAAPSADTISDSAISAAGISVAALPSAPARGAPPAGRRRAALVAGLLLTGAVAGGYWVTQRGATSSGAEPTRAAATTAPEASPSPPDESATPPAAEDAPSSPSAAAREPETQEVEAQEVELGDQLWIVREEPAESCAELVPDTSELRKGDVAQSGLFWDKARSALVLGDSHAARAHLCRAVLVYSASLAVEALAESYVALHAPSQAKTWIEAALTQRPGRPKTLELSGDVEAQLGHLEQARAAWTRALSVQESDQKTLDAVAKQLVSEGQSALRSGNVPRAEVLLRRAAGLSPSQLDAPEALARLYEAQGQSGPAAAWRAEAARRRG